MAALLIPFLVKHFELPAWAVKLILVVLFVCLVVISVAIATWQLRAYAEHETQIAVTQASSAAKAEVAAKVNATAEEMLRATEERQAANMAILEKAQSDDTAAWSALADSLNSIPETPAHVTPAPVPLLLGAVPPVEPVLPTGERGSGTSGARPLPAPVRPVPAAAPVRPHVPGFDALVAADRAADRMLERTTGAP